MTDNLTRAQRRRCMQNVRTAGTDPELAVRAMLRDLGVRFRTANADLPGSPDLANRSAAWVIFVHGCFWHGHKDCPRARLPATNMSFWAAKIGANVARDRAVLRTFRVKQYRVITVWQCQLQAPARVRKRLGRVLAAH